MALCACGGALMAWFLLGLFVYLRDSKGGISIWGLSWDVVLVILPAIPALFLIETIAEIANRRG